MYIQTADIQGASNLPKRFSLLPFEDGSLQVNVAAEVVGYVWASDNSWHARNLDGDKVNTYECLSVQAAVVAVFESHNDEFVLG